jgi:hypothetical protein
MLIRQTFDPAAPVICNPTRAEAGAQYRVSVAAIGTLVESGGTASTTVDDVAVTRHTSSTVDQSGRVLVSGVATEPTFSSLTPHIGTVDAVDSRLVGKSPSTARAIFTTQNHGAGTFTVWTYGGAGSGTFITPQIAAINAMIATADAQAGVSTGLEVSSVDLSTYTDFSS